MLLAQPGFLQCLRPYPNPDNMRLSPQGTCPSYYYGNRLIQSRLWLFTPNPSLTGKLVDTFAQRVSRAVSPSKVLRKSGISGDFQPPPFDLRSGAGQRRSLTYEHRTNSRYYSHRSDTNENSYRRFRSAGAGSMTLGLRSYRRSAFSSSLSSPP
jgi:hypothetical protein